MEKHNELNQFIELVNYIKNFPKDIFQGEVSYYKVPKDIMLYELFGHFQMFLYLLDKKDSNFINISKYYAQFYKIFNNIELNELEIINLYLDINKQENYIRNVKSAAFIIYKENWNPLLAPAQDH